jgi:hypothetical protein
LPKSSTEKWRFCLETRLFFWFLRKEPIFSENCRKSQKNVIIEHRPILGEFSPIGRQFTLCSLIKKSGRHFGPLFSSSRLRVHFDKIWIGPDLVGFFANSPGQLASCKFDFFSISELDYKNGFEINLKFSTSNLKCKKVN